jgi:hypothetical protein
VFQLDFEIFRTIASFVKISSGHSLIIKLIFIKFFRTIWKLGGQMSRDWCLADNRFLFKYCINFKTTNQCCIYKYLWRIMHVIYISLISLSQFSLCVVDMHKKNMFKQDFIDHSKLVFFLWNKLYLKIHIHVWHLLIF